MQTQSTTTTVYEGMGIDGKPSPVTLINGIRVRMKAGELAAHLLARAEHHRGRAKAKGAELPKLKDVLEAIRPKPDDERPSNVSKVASNSYYLQESQVEALERDIRDHEAKAFNFSWLAGHLFEQDYCLTQSDLIELEITQR